MSRSRQLRVWFTFARWFAKVSGLHFLSSQWVLRRELGEIFGRPHFHFLIVCPNHRDSQLKGLCLSAMNKWEGLGMGMARIIKFDRSQAGAAYVAKCLGSGQTKGSGTQAYELNKFGAADELILSNCLAERLRRLPHAQDWRS